MTMRASSSNHAVPLVGMDIGGTKTSLVLGNTQGQVLRRVEIPTPASLPFDAAFEMLCSAMDMLLVECKTEGLGQPKAISVSVGGPLDIERGVLYSPPHLSTWGEAPVKAWLEEQFDLPVYVEHDGNAGALAEFMFGAGRGSRNMIFLTMGTGLGAGLILNGRLYRGSNDQAGEVGHVRLADAGPVGYGKIGSWEAFSSGDGLVKLAHWRQPGRWPENITTRELISGALEGDPAARDVISEAGRWFGHGLAILVDLLNPEVIVIGTLGVLLGDLLLEPARQVLQAEALPRAVGTCRIVPAELGSRLGDVASLMAGIMALQKTAQ